MFEGYELSVGPKPVWVKFMLGWRKHVGAFCQVHKKMTCWNVTHHLKLNFNIQTYLWTVLSRFPPMTSIIGTGLSFCLHQTRIHHIYYTLLSKIVISYFHISEKSNTHINKVTPWKSNYIQHMLIISFCANYGRASHSFVFLNPVTACCCGLIKFWTHVEVSTFKQPDNCSAGAQTRLDKDMKNILWIWNQGFFCCSSEHTSSLMRGSQSLSQIVDVLTHLILCHKNSMHLKSSCISLIFLRGAADRWFEGEMG